MRGILLALLALFFWAQEGRAWYFEDGTKEPEKIYSAGVFGRTVRYEDRGKKQSVGFGGIRWGTGDYTTFGNDGMKGLVSEVGVGAGPLTHRSQIEGGEYVDYESKGFGAEAYAQTGIQMLIVFFHAGVTLMAVHADSSQLPQLNRVVLDPYLSFDVLVPIGNAPGFVSWRFGHSTVGMDLFFFFW